MTFTMVIGTGFALEAGYEETVGAVSLWTEAKTLGALWIITTAFARDVRRDMYNFIPVKNENIIYLIFDIDEIPTTFD